MESLPASLAERLRELTYNERSVAYLQVDAALLLIGAGGHLENYGLAAIRLGEPAAEQVFFLEGLLPLEETPFFVPSVELDCGRAADLHLYLDAGTVWVVLLDVTAYRDATRRLQQKAYEMTLLQEKEAQLNRRLEDANRELEAANDFLVRISTKISHYLAPQIYKSIFSGQKDVTIHTERKELTIFFSDIMGFTATTERLQPEQITLLLNEYFTEMSAIALKHGGTVDKFIGDALVIFFGDPETKGTVEDARACLHMATEMQRRLAELNVKWRSAGTEHPFRVRMGINTGFCNVGNFGSVDRMDYTAIGAEVNLAARLQSIAEPGHIVISYETYALVRDIVAARALQEISVKGISRAVVPYVVEGVLDEAGRKIEIFSEHMTGLDFYLDPRAVDATALERIRETLRNAIAALEGRGG
jgi:class 3 adenylate cyclase